MNILVVDDNRDDLDVISDIVWENLQDDEILEFENPLYALAKARIETIDIAFLDIGMPELDGITLGRYLKELNPFINIIFVSNHTEHGFEAFDMHASGYLKKPATDAAVKRELSELRYKTESVSNNRVFVQTFGNFEIFVDGNPLEFKYSRTKEVFAILINNRGAYTSNGEIIGDLWEDDGDPEKKLSYLRNLRQDMVNTFTRLELDGIILKQRGSMAIAKDRIDCDLYDWLEKRGASKYSYTGDYMNQYSWSEYYHAELDMIE